jgi:hypothetical protein
MNEYKIVAHYINGSSLIISTYLASSPFDAYNIFWATLDDCETSIEWLQLVQPEWVELPV